MQVEYLKEEKEGFSEKDLGKHHESVNFFEENKKISLDDFEYIKVLGRGAFGKVMLVEKKDTKKLYALKTI